MTGGGAQAACKWAVLYLSMLYCIMWGLAGGAYTGGTWMEQDGRKWWRDLLLSECDMSYWEEKGGAEERGNGKGRGRSKGEGEEDEGGGSKGEWVDNYVNI